MLEKGEIIYRNNLVFADNGKLDLKIAGHPTLNITDGTSGEIFFFLITSTRIKGKENEQRYFKLEKNNSSGLHKSSWVDLFYVFKEPSVNRVPAGFISDNLLNEIFFNFLISFQNNNVIYTKEQMKNIQEMLKHKDLNLMTKEIFNNKNSVIKECPAT